MHINLIELTSSRTASVVESIELRGPVPPRCKPTAKTGMTSALTAAPARPGQVVVDWRCDSRRQSLALNWIGVASFPTNPRRRFDARARHGARCSPQQSRGRSSGPVSPAQLQMQILAREPRAHGRARALFARKPTLKRGDSGQSIDKQRRCASKCHRGARPPMKVQLHGEGPEPVVRTRRPALGRHHGSNRHAATKLSYYYNL